MKKSSKKSPTRPKRTPITTARSAPMSVFPAHLNCTANEWRAKKRQEWREVMQALQRFTYGSAYAPGHRQLWEMQGLATQVEELVEPSDWTAW